MSNNATVFPFLLCVCDHPEYTGQKCVSRSIGFDAAKMLVRQLFAIPLDVEFIFRVGCSLRDGLLELGDVHEDVWGDVVSSADRIFIVLSMQVQQVEGNGERLEEGEGKVERQSVEDWLRGGQVAVLQGDEQDVIPLPRPPAPPRAISTGTRTRRERTAAARAAAAVKWRKVRRTREYIPDLKAPCPRDKGGILSRRWALGKHIQAGGKCDQCKASGMECKVDTRTDRRIKCWNCHETGLQRCTLPKGQPQPRRIRNNRGQNEREVRTNVRRSMRGAVQSAVEGKDEEGEEEEEEEEEKESEEEDEDEDEGSSALTRFDDAMEDQDETSGGDRGGDGNGNGDGDERGELEELEEGEIQASIGLEEGEIRESVALEEVDMDIDCGESEIVT